MDRRELLSNGGFAMLGAVALGAIVSGGPAEAHEAVRDGFPEGLSSAEREHLRTFDELDFEIFLVHDWPRFAESHAPDVKVHWPDGRTTEGLDAHVADIQAMIAWAPDTRVTSHPIRIAMNDYTAVTGVLAGTFTRPMPDGHGGHIPPTGRSFAITMTTIGLWNRHGRMDQEFLFWDNRSFDQQIGLTP